MRRAIVIMLATLSLMTGCIGTDPDAKLPASDRPGPGDTFDDPRDDPLYDPTIDNASRADPPRTTIVPILLDGNLGSGATACVFGPVGQCHAVPVQDGERGLILSELAGWIEGGEVTLTWEAGSPAVEELAAGFMLMDGGDGCEGVELGGAHGPSPLTVAIAEAARPLCSGEVVHLWVSGNNYGFHDPAYYQVDVDQEFHAEGSFLLRELAEP